MTNGHLDVVRRASALFDEVVVAVLANPAKKGLFDPAERIELIEAGLAERGTPPNVRVELVVGGLLVDYCARIGAQAVVKGLRSGTDFAYELPMALMNRHLSGLETLFLPGDPAFEHVSSSLIKEVAAHGGDIEGLVPAVVATELKRRLRA